MLIDGVLGVRGFDIRKTKYATDDDFRRAVLAVEREATKDLQATFDLRWKADMRAIKMWQAAHPGNELVWPDHADLVVWLLEQLEKQRG